MMDSIACVNSIFEQPWWLEAVAPGRWGVAEVEKGGKIVARLPYVKTKRIGSKLLAMPAYTQTLGYWIDDTGAKNAKKYSRQKDLISELINMIPKEYSVDISLDHTCDYLFPFKWNGYNLQMNYSYRMENIEDIELLWSGLSENIKTDIKKAQKIITIEDNHSIKDLMMMQKKTFEKQGRSINDDELIFRLDKVLMEHNARKLLCAVDAENRIHAAAYYVFDSNRCYYLMGGGDPELRKSGATSLVLWEGIKFASTVSKSFDFEGSMIEPIERFFRAFGGKPTPYWRVTKLNLALSIVDYMKPKIKKLVGWK